MGAVSINYIAVVVAAIISMVLGFIWYAPKVFGGRWLKLTKVKPEKKGMGATMAVGFVSSIVTALVLSIIVDFADAVTFVDGLLLGVLVWFGLVATTQLGSVLWERRPKELFFINTAFSLVNLALIGGILAVWI